MTLSFPENRSSSSDLSIRPVQYRDLEALASLAAESVESEPCPHESIEPEKQFQKVRRWYGLLKFLSFFPNPMQHNLCAYVAEQAQQILGWIKVAPFNSTRSTWRVEQVAVTRQAAVAPAEIGSQLLRHCFEKIWEARTWLVEVNIHHNHTLALYRRNGFQPLAQMTYWMLPPELLAQLADNEPDLPNLLPVSNVDAQLIYQLDTVSMPPLLRQVFDRHLQDFKTNFLAAGWHYLQQWLQHTEVVKSYVFEPQRKAAIGYFQLHIARDGSRPHQASLTVHPAYTWLYPELLTQMARVVQGAPPQALQLDSADYQPEREEYLEQLGAERTEHTLLMSRSVWHKLREAKSVASLERLQLSDVLQGLQPRRTPVPGRMSWLNSMANPASLHTGSPVEAPAREEGKFQCESLESPDKSDHTPCQRQAVGEDCRRDRI